MIYRGRGRRTAFTMIEMLVVIVIIAILASLTVAAVMRARLKGPELQTKTDIAQLESKLGEAKSQVFNNVPVLPSHLRLREDNKYVDPAWNGSPPLTALQADYNQTKRFLQQAFGRHVCYDFAYPVSSSPYATVTVNGTTHTTTFIDWNGNGTQDAGDMVLEGQQCLVFWLGGIPQYSGTTIGMTGFSTTNQVNPAENPAANPWASNSSRTRPFEFLAPRLKAVLGQGSGATATFPEYLDGWASLNPPAQQKPYAFFASYKTEGNGLYQADCPSLGVTPYTLATGAFVYPGSFQIISAGRDGAFGPGGVWDPVNGLATPAAVKDDQANFTPHPLDSPAN